MSLEARAARLAELRLLAHEIEGDILYIEADERAATNGSLLRLGGLRTRLSDIRRQIMEIEADDCG